MLLREQEWQLARLLYKQQRLGEELKERAENAVSETVRESMRPQFEAISAVGKAIERRVAAIVAYGDKVRLAMTKQREWEQIEAARARDDAYGELLAEAATKQLGADHLRTATDLEAIRKVWEASIREVSEAGRWLAEVADLLSSDEPD